MRWALLVIVACSSPDRGPRFMGAGHSSPVDGGTLRFAVTDQVRTLDPTVQYEETSSYGVHPVYETLIDFEPARREDDRSGYTLEPRLAERWEVSADGLAYHFWLRDGITFSDGEPVVAGDFVYALDRALTKPDSGYLGFLAGVAGYQDVIDQKKPHCECFEALNDRELVIHLDKPNRSFLESLTLSFATPMKRAWVEKVGDQIQHEALGTGPFEVETWEQGRRLVLKKNARYWNASAIHLDRIEMIENVPRDTQFLMFQAGEIDAAERLSAPDYLWIMDQPAWAPYVQSRAMMYSYGSRMNVEMKPFTDRRVRQAMNYAVNKQHEVKLLMGAATISHGILPPGVFGRDDKLQPYPHDPAKAHALLAEAGYPDGFDVDYVVMSDDEASRLASSLQADLAEVGVRVHLQVVTLATYATAIGKRHGAAFGKGTWVGDYPDPADFFDPLFQSKSIGDENSSNSSFYSNPALDQLLEDARAEADVTKRAEMYRQAERIVYDDAPWIWEYHQSLTEVVQPYLKGYGIHPIRLRDFTRAWLDK
ncbi:MAG: ABC transporter substrate-binding protein [Kofleriaceae bacterium]